MTLYFLGHKENLTESSQHEYALTEDIKHTT